MLTPLLMNSNPASQHANLVPRGLESHIGVLKLPPKNPNNPSPPPKILTLLELILNHI